MPTLSVFPFHQMFPFEPKRSACRFGGNFPNPRGYMEESDTVIHARARGDLVEFTVYPASDRIRGSLTRAATFVGAMASSAIVGAGCQIILKEDRQPTEK